MVVLDGSGSGEEKIKQVNRRKKNIYKLKEWKRDMDRQEGYEWRNIEKCVMVYRQAKKNMQAGRDLKIEKCGIDRWCGDSQNYRNEKRENEITYRPPKREKK